MNNKPMLPRSQIGGDNDDTVALNEVADKVADQVIDKLEKAGELEEVTDDMEAEVAHQVAEKVKDDDNDVDEDTIIGNVDDAKEVIAAKVTEKVATEIEKRNGEEESTIRLPDGDEDILATEGVFTNPINSLCGGSQSGGYTENYDQLSEFTTSATSAAHGHASATDQYGGSNNDDHYKLKYLKYKTKVMKLRSQL